MSVSWTIGRYFCLCFFFIFYMACFSNCCFYYIYVTCILTVSIFIICALLLFYGYKLYCTAFFYSCIMSYICYVIHACDVLILTCLINCHLTCWILCVCVIDDDDDDVINQHSLMSDHIYLMSRYKSGF